MRGMACPFAPLRASHARAMPRAQVPSRHHRRARALGQGEARWLRVLALFACVLGTIARQGYRSGGASDLKTLLHRIDADIAQLERRGLVAEGRQVRVTGIGGSLAHLNGIYQEYEVVD